MIATLKKFVRRYGLAATRCMVCGGVIGRNEERLCPECATMLPMRTGGYCPQCGELYGRADAPPSLCPECRHDPPPWERLYFHGHYSGQLRELILGYKFNDSLGRARLLSDMALRTFDNKGERIPDVIVPVPLHTRRLLKRGFNQSLEISRRLAASLDRPVAVNGLVRTRNTVPQTRLGHKERQANIKDAFTATEDMVAGITVLLVDDVYTTGATLRECAQTLARAGATGVDVLVLARAQRD